MEQPGRDDLHGADFVGDNVGDLLTDDVSSQDANPDIPMGGTWINDPLAFPWGIRFEGDPAVGDAVDNNLDFFSDLGVFHGTFVAAIAAAMTDNINPDTGEFEGMAGACWNCRIMAVRMVNAEGNGYGSDAAAAIYYAADMGADIINLSWGFDLDSLDATGQAEVAIMRDAINHAVSQGVIVVASAGNSGGPALRFPASMANTIAVGSSNWLDRRSGFSTIAAAGELPDNGIDDDGNGRIDDALDIVAPGKYIWSGIVYSAYDSLQSQLLGDPAIEPGLDAYGNSNGTSFSAPLAAGYVGLLLSRFPDATLSDIHQALRAYATDLLDPEGTGSSLSGYDASSGFGRMNMVVPASLGDAPPPPPSPAPAGPVISRWRSISSIAASTAIAMAPVNTRVFWRRPSRMTESAPTNCLSAVMTSTALMRSRSISTTPSLPTCPPGPTMASTAAMPSAWGRACLREAGTGWSSASAQAALAGV